MASFRSPTPEQVTQKLEQLRLPLSPDINYDLPKIFPRVHSWFFNGQVRKKARLIRLLEPKLLQILHEGEEVLYVAKGVEQSFLEAFFMGFWWASLLNQTVFVLTNVNVIMMRSNSRGKPLHQFWVIYYSEIDRLQSTWNGSMTLRLVDRQKRTFSGIPRKERLAMIQVFKEALDDYRELGFAPEATQSVETLCCHCFETVPCREFECPQCRTTYWKPRELALRSLIIPSWGDFMMKHYGFAVCELLGYCVGLLAFLFPFFDPANPLNMADAASRLATFFILAHCVDAAMTYAVASKGLYARTRPVNAMA